MKPRKQVKLGGKGNLAAEDKACAPKKEHDITRGVCVKPMPSFEIDSSSTVRNQQRKDVIQKIAKWMYQAGISLDSITLKSFEVAVDAISQFGPGMEPPSYHEIRGPLLSSASPVDVREIELQTR